MHTLSYFKDGRSYEERTDHPLMDGIGYVTDLLNSQERAPPVSMRPTNQMFNSIYRKAGQAYKASTPTRKTKLNKLMNDTIRTSAPQFHVEQLLKVDQTTRFDTQGRYKFKLDPNFMSSNSVYKTIALRGIYMKPKRYNLQYALEMEVKLVESSTPAEDGGYEPSFEYTRLETTPVRYINAPSGEGLSSVYAVIKDDEGYEYTIDYAQHPEYREGETYRVTQPIVTSIYMDGEKVGVSLNSNVVKGIDLGDGIKADIEFWPQGYVTITKRYIENNREVAVILEIEKDAKWDMETTECSYQKTKVIQGATIRGIKVPFKITLLPENSIEVFAHEVKTLVNKSLKAYESTDIEPEDEAHIKQCEIDYTFHPTINVLVFTWESLEEHVEVSARFVPVDEKHEGEAYTFYNILNQRRFRTYPEMCEDCVEYENVWNREDFYVHASFMNLVQYNQLGRTGELYPKPTKLTKYTQNIPDIELWTSLNGVDPFILVDQDFDVALALAATLNNADITF